MEIMDSMQGVDDGGHPGPAGREPSEEAGDPAMRVDDIEGFALHDGGELADRRQAPGLAQDDVDMTDADSSRRLDEPAFPAAGDRDLELVPIEPARQVQDRHLSSAEERPVDDLEDPEPAAHRPVSLNRAANRRRGGSEAAPIVPRSRRSAKPARR